MKKSMKAAIFSAVLFPGSGYFIVKSTEKALMAMVLALSCLAVVVYDAIYKAEMIVEKLTQNRVSMETIDAAYIQQELLLTAGYFSPSVVDFALLLFAVVWIFGMVDGYKMGKKLDQQSM